VSAESLKKTALNAWHKAQGGQMVGFAGWELPVQYRGLAEEHLATRAAAGLFDISHMGQVRVDGPQALEFLQAITTNDVARLAPGRMQYSTLPAPDGGLIDDIIVSRLERGYFVVVNASNTPADLAWMREQAGRFEVSLKHLPRSMFALQGPKSQALLQPLTPLALDGLRYYALAPARVAGREALLSRSGYTGEDGFEICLEDEDALPVWEALMAAGIGQGLAPVGLGARNTLRLEMGYALYGHEIDRGTNPIEAGLGWVVKFDKGPFVGREAMQAMSQLGPQRRLVGFELVDRGVARDGYPVLDPASGAQVGRVTSGSPSPSTGKSVGLAYVPAALAAEGSLIHVEMRGKALAARVRKPPFTPSHVRKN
jgi:aminomethyltransferase